jgi:hypothetical protein
VSIKVLPFYIKRHLYRQQMMASSRIACALMRTTLRTSRNRASSSAFLTIPHSRRAASSKHPKSFTPPSAGELIELRDTVQEFCKREISEEVAHKTDQSNAFPADMWRKLGEAGCVQIVSPFPCEMPNASYLGYLGLLQMKIVEDLVWVTRLT